MPYRKVEAGGDCAMYLEVTEEGVVNFLWSNPRDQSGFGGRRFELLMVDGTTEVLIGPWSSNPEAVRYFFPDLPELVEDRSLSYHRYLVRK